MDMMEIRRRVLLGSRKKKRLPDEYQEVEYIESSGTQWIDTGISPTIHTRAKLKFVNLVASGYVIFGYYNSEYTSWRMFNNQNWNYLDFPSNENKSYRYMTRVETSIYPNKLIELEIGNKFKKILRNDGYPKLINTEFNDTPIDDFVSTTKTLTLNYYSDNHISLNRWYYVKIYDGDILVRNMIPCYRKSDSEIGMYDTVSQTFYTNAGTGTFLKGADV